jgi:integrase
MRGDGRIYRRNASPIWTLAYWGPDATTGKWREIRESSHSTDENKARRLLRRRVQEIANHRAGRGRFIGPPQDKITVRELLSALVRDYETRRLRSLPQCVSNVRHLTRHLGNELAVSLRRDRLNWYVGIRRSEGASDTTIDRETEKLGRAFQIAIDESRLAFKPKIPRLVKMHSNARQGFFEYADFKAVADATADADVRDFLWWMFYTGMRPKEIRSLTWDAFDRETWTLTLAARDAKTGHGRTFPLGGAWREIIERRLVAREFGCAFVFHHKGRRMADATRLRAFRSACRRAGVEGMLTYDLRRTAVRNMLQAGIDERVAMAVTGHVTRSTFDRYRIVNSANLRDAAAKLSGYVGGLPSEREKVREWPKC